MTSLYLSASLKCMQNVIGTRKLIKHNLTILRQLTAGKNTSCSATPLKVEGHERRHEFNFSVSRFGQLQVRTGACCHLNIEPVNPELCPDQNIARVISVFASDLRKTDSLQKQVEYKDNCLSIYTKDTGNVHVVQPIEELNVTVPIKFDIDVEVSGNSRVSVNNIQNERIILATEQGCCSIDNIKSDDVKIRSAGGNIICDGLLRGNATLETKNQGYITINRPLGVRLDVTTEHGDITVDSLYAERSKFSVQSGNVQIKNAHRCVDIKIVNDGNISIDSLDGSLSASLGRGDVTVYACRHNSVDIVVESGNIVIKVPESLESNLELAATTVNLDEKLDSSNLVNCNSQGCVTVSGFVTSSADEKLFKKAAINAKTKQGTIKVVCQDWLSSLKLGDFEETQ